MSSARERVQSDSLSQRFRSARKEFERAHVLSEALDDVPGAEGISADDLGGAGDGALRGLG